MRSIKAYTHLESVPRPGKHKYKDLFGMPDTAKPYEDILRLPRVETAGRRNRSIDKARPAFHHGLPAQGFRLLLRETQPMRVLVWRSARPRAAMKGHCVTRL